MAKRPKLSEAEILEQDRVALENAESQPEIAAEMTELGFDTAKINEGKAILADTRQKFDSNKKEDDETSVAYADFSSKKSELEDIFTLHRKKAKVIFRNDPVTAEKLAISGTMPRTYISRTEAAKKFYSVALGDTNIQTQIARLKISVKDLKAAEKLIKDLEASRAVYLKERGESQDATKIKDAAFIKLNDWMSEFYSVARIALEDNPQLLEALGKVVKS